uniref:TLDc domain-containing protein n=1 Tax=Astyanax mexicanus TaxID=7994 RepID=A0A8B9KNS7_ASTMX
MSSIVSSLGEEKEWRLRGLFLRPVRLHLLYKSSHHGADISTLLCSFDSCGSFVLAVFLQSGEVRGGFTSKSLKNGSEFTDEEAFLFEINNNARRFPVNKPARAVQVHFTESAPSSSSLFGSAAPRSTAFGLSAGFALTVMTDDGFCLDVGDILPNPWRELSWTEENRKRLRENFVSYKLVVETVSQVRALLLGPVGSGKSSLINSIRSTMFKRIMHLPNVGTAAGSFTKKVSRKHGGPPTALSLCDVMAIGDEDFTGLSLSDTLAVIKGHVPEGYQFQSDVPISDKISDYRAAPTLKDQVHGVLFVLDASKVLMHLQGLVKLAELVGLPLSYVVPVKNYMSELSVDRNTDILLLSAVNIILQAVDDALEDQYPEDEKND